MNTKRTTTKGKTLKQRNLELKKWEAEIDETNRKNFEAIAFALVPLVAKSRRIEWEIVSNFLRRTDQLLIDGKKSRADFAAKYPQFAKPIKADEAKRARA